jgi:hypothetical protein
MTVEELAKAAAEEVNEVIASSLDVNVDRCDFDGTSAIIARHFSPLAAELDQWERDCDRIQGMAKAMESMMLNMITPHLPKESDGSPCLGGRSVMLACKKVVTGLSAELDRLREQNRKLREALDNLLYKECDDMDQTRVNIVAGYDALAACEPNKETER